MSWRARGFCIRGLLALFRLPLRLLLLPRGFELPLALPAAVPALGTINYHGLRHLLLPARDLLRALFLALLVSLAQRGHGRLQQRSVGMMEFLEFVRVHLAT